MGWGRVKNGTDAGWKPEKPKPLAFWRCKCKADARPPYWLNCPFCHEKRPY